MQWSHAPVSTQSSTSGLAHAVCSSTIVEMHGYSDYLQWSKAKALLFEDEAVQQGDEADEA